MLVLSRHVGEAISIEGPCRITVVRLGPNTVKIGIDADRSTKILRGELQAGGSPEVSQATEPPATTEA